MAQADVTYHNLVEAILHGGVKKEDRTGTGTISIFGSMMKFDLKGGKIPLLTTKKMFTKGIIYELFWFLGAHLNDKKYFPFGLTNLKYLVDNNVNIWVGDAYKKYKTSSKIDLPSYTEKEFIDKIKTDDSFAKTFGELGPIYGKQWIGWETNFDSINQIQNLLYDLKNNPDSRRLMVTAWNPPDVPEATLPPCHYGFQCWTRELSLQERNDYYTSNFLGLDCNSHEELDKIGDIPKRALRLKFQMRSIDTPLGCPYNIASYAILTHMLAHCSNMVAEELTFSGGDTHIYLNQIDGINEQLERDPNKYESPTIKINSNIKDIWKLTPEDIKIINYNSYPTIHFPLSN